MRLISFVRKIQENELCGLIIGQGKQIILTAYADNIVVLAESEDNLKITEKLTDAAKYVGLVVNKNKTKSMIISRRDYLQKTIKIKYIYFEKVRSFKYLGIDINSQEDSHEEIYRRITA